MRQFSFQEKIAVALGVLVIFTFLPLYSSFLSLGAGDDRAATDSRSDAIRNIQQALTEVEIEDFVVGDGPKARQGDTLFLHYVGQLESGETFDTSVNQDDPFILSLGSGRVISGWELGLDGMREGGTRRLVIPPELAYGESEIVASDGTVLVPANSTLVFDIVLLKVERPF